MPPEALFSRSTVNYTLSTFFVKAMAICASFTIAKLLAPAEYGLWITLSLIIAYMANINFGLLNAMNREVPYFNGKKDFQEVDKILSTVFTGTVFLAGSICLALVAISYIPFFGNIFSRFTIWLRFLAPVVFLQQVYLYYQLYYRGYHRFDFLSRLEPFFAATSTLLMAAFVYIFRSVSCLLFALSLSYILALAYNYKRNRFIPSVRIDPGRTAHLLKIGFPILLSGLMGTLFFTAQRLVIVSFLGNEQLGYYGIPIMTEGIFQLLPSIVAVIVYPRFVQLYGLSDGDVEKLRAPFILITSFMALFLAAGLGFVYFIIPLFVNVFLPVYAPGILPAQLIAIGIFFYCTSFLTGIFLVTINKQINYICFLVSGFLVNAGLNSFFVLRGWGLAGVATGTGLTYFLYFLTSLSFIFRHFKDSADAFKAAFMKIFLPFIYFVSGVMAIELFLGSSFPKTSPMAAAIKICLFALWCLPLSFFYFRTGKFRAELMEIKDLIGMRSITSAGDIE